MNPCVLYFSRTGNTKRAAEAIANAVGAPALDITSSEPAAVEKYDLLILGTPVEGFSPAKETSAFVERIPNASGKKAILFCTYSIWKGSTFKALEKQLNAKGYTCISNASKKGMKPDKTADFTDIISEIKKAIP